MENEQWSWEYHLIVLSIIWATKKLAIMIWNAMMGEGGAEKNVWSYRNTSYIYLSYTVFTPSPRNVTMA